MRLGLMGSWLAAMAILAWDEINTKQRIPEPQTFMHAVIVWAVLGIIADLGAPDVAAIFGVGLVLSMAYVYFSHKPAPSTGKGLTNAPGTGPEEPAGTGS